MKKIYLFITDAGGGHRIPAIALKNLAMNYNSQWDVKVVNIFREVPQNHYATVGEWLEKIYILIQKKNLGWLLYPFAALFKIFWQTIRKDVHKMLFAYWQKNPPDLVISLMPIINGAVQQNLHQYNPNIPFITIFTDFDEWCPTAWIESKDQYYICGTDKTEQQLIQYGVQHNRIFRTSGLIVNPAFYQIEHAKNKNIKVELGLDPNLPVGLVMFGAHNSKITSSILEQLKDAENYQLIFICGYNTKLEEKIKAANTKLKKWVVGYSDDIPFYMGIADFFIGKPGANCVSEALVAKLPVILTNNFSTMPQEKYVATWIQKHNLGLLFSKSNELDGKISELLENYQDYKKRLDKFNNRAIFEIIDIINSILEASPSKKTSPFYAGLKSADDLGSAATTAPLASDAPIIPTRE